MRASRLLLAAPGSAAVGATETLRVVIVGDQPRTEQTCPGPPSVRWGIRLWCRIEHMFSFVKRFCGW